MEVKDDKNFKNRLSIWKAWLLIENLIDVGIDFYKQTNKNNVI